MRKLGFRLFATLACLVAMSSSVVLAKAASRSGGGYGPVWSASGVVLASADSREAIPAGRMDPEARSKATEIFESRCVACHGEDGRGDGPGASNISPKPASFHDSKWQSSVTDKEIAKAIVYGGRAVGRSGQMAANPDLADEPAVVSALVERIRTFGK